MRFGMLLVESLATAFGTTDSSEWAGASGSSAFRLSTKRPGNLGRYRPK